MFALLFLAQLALAIPTDPWVQPEDGPVAALFKRAPLPPSDPMFLSQYPPGWAVPPASSIPQAWKDRLATLSLPSFGPSSPNNGYPTYAGGVTGADPSICSFTYECKASDDLILPPDNTFALSFDDGPAISSTTLYDFLAEHNIGNAATHFMIGQNILANPTIMQAAAAGGGHLAVHTWSHPYMTTLSNEDVMSELGWTMQIISDLNGGRLPKYWRPPYGDVDNRVRAIAKGVFGLETVPWDKDSDDFYVGERAETTYESVQSLMAGWIAGPKSPGLNILEHEHKNTTVQVFINAYPNIVAAGWTIKNIADAWGMGWYQNAASNTGDVTEAAVGGGVLATDGTASSVSASPSSSSASVPTSASTSESTSASASISTSASASVSASSAGAASPSSSSGAASSLSPQWLWALGPVLAVLLR